MTLWVWSLLPLADLERAVAFLYIKSHKAQVVTHSWHQDLSVTNHSPLANTPIILSE